MKHHKRLFHHIHKKGLDKLGYVFILLGVISIAPQVYQIFTTQSADDINFLSWVIYTMTGLFWLWFAIERKINLLMIASLVGLGIKAVMLYGIYSYGNADFRFI